VPPNFITKMAMKPIRADARLPLFEIALAIPVCGAVRKGCGVCGAL